MEKTEEQKKKRRIFMINHIILENFSYSQIHEVYKLVTKFKKESN